MTYEKEHRCLVNAVFKASQLCRIIRGDSYSRYLKDDFTPVTIADFSSQALICNSLSAEFPDDPIVAEEDSSSLTDSSRKSFTENIISYVTQFLPGATGPEIIEMISRGKGPVTDRFWTVDPIDGTKGFISGRQYSVAAALIEKGTVVAAALGCPAMDPLTVYSAVRGEGIYSTSDGKKIRPYTVPEKEAPSCIVHSLEQSSGNREVHLDIAHELGINETPLELDSQLKYLSLIHKEASVYLRIPGPSNMSYREKIWDHAAGSLLIEEAGGTVTNRYGEALDFSRKILEPGAGVCASINFVHSRITEIISQKHPVSPKELQSS